MLARKSIALGSMGDALDSMPGIIKSEDIGLINSYETFLLKKMTEADAIIEKAHENSRQIAKNAKEQAEIEFWKQTQHIHCEIQNIKKLLMVEIESQCSELMMACLKNLVDEIPSRERIKPLINAVLEKYNSEEPARLLVNPEQLSLVTELMPTMAIPVQADASVDKDSVILKTDKSQYESSFSGKLSLLVKSFK